MALPGSQPSPKSAQAPTNAELAQQMIALRARVQLLEDALTVASKMITLKTGSSSIILKADGTIEIKGRDITIQGSGKVNVKSSGEVTLKGSQIRQN